MKYDASETVIYDDEGINYDDIPEITDFSKGKKNPYAKLFKDGYTITIEHEDYDEIITIKKTRREKEKKAV